MYKRGHGNTTFQISLFGHHSHKFEAFMLSGDVRSLPCKSTMGGSAVIFVPFMVNRSCHLVHLAQLCDHLLSWSRGEIHLITCSHCSEVAAVGMSRCRLPPYVNTAWLDGITMTPKLFEKHGKWATEGGCCKMKQLLRSSSFGGEEHRLAFYESAFQWKKGCVIMRECGLESCEHEMNLGDRELEMLNRISVENSLMASCTRAKREHYN